MVILLMENVDNSCLKGCDKFCHCSDFGRSSSDFIDKNVCFAGFWQMKRWARMRCTLVIRWQLSNLQMLSKGVGFEESDRKLMLEQCLKVAEIMRMILVKFHEVREYRTIPYVADTKILDVSLDSIHGAPEIPDDQNRPRCNVSKGVPQSERTAWPANNSCVPFLQSAQDFSDHFFVHQADGKEKGFHWPWVGTLINNPMHSTLSSRFRLLIYFFNKRIPGTLLSTYF